MLLLIRLPCSFHSPWGKLWESWERRTCWPTTWSTGWATAWSPTWRSSASRLEVQCHITYCDILYYFNITFNRKSNPENKYTKQISIVDVFKASKVPQSCVECVKMPHSSLTTLSIITVWFTCTFTLVKMTLWNVEFVNRYYDRR